MSKFQLSQDTLVFVYSGIFHHQVMKLLIKPDEVWYQIPTEKEIPTQTSESFCDAQLKSRAATFYQEQCRKYREEKLKAMSFSDRQWLETVLKKGTLSDRISTISLQIREAPFYGLEWLTKLLEMAASESRHESYPALDVLKDIFALILPPRNIRGDGMKSWKERGFMGYENQHTITKTILLAYFEDALCHAYSNYLKLLEIHLHDQVGKGREKALRIAFELALAYKSEFTAILCAALTNKLGDPDRKIASRTVYYLQCIVEKHEDLTLPIVKLVQNEVLKPNAPNDKAAYYGLTFFSEIRLAEDSPQVTTVLLDTYRYFLEQFLAQLENMNGSDARGGGKRVRVGKRRRHEMMEKRLDNIGEENKWIIEGETPRLVKVVFTGLTRAIPFVKAEGLLEYAKKLLNITNRVRSFPTLLQAVALIFCIFSTDITGTGKNDQNTEQSMITISKMVCESLLDYTIMANATSYHPKLFKFLYKVMTQLGESYSPAALTCLRIILKSLLSISVGVGSSAFAAATLLLLNEALGMKPALRLAITFPEDVVEKGNGETPIPNDTTSVGEQLFWELNILATHYHPVVARYATTLLQPNGEIDIRNEPDDPFQSMSHSVFLESFIKGSS